MQEPKEAYEKVPEFVIDSRSTIKRAKLITEIAVPKEEPEDITAKIWELSEEEQKQIKTGLSRPSSLRVDLPQTLVDFDNYKGNLAELFNDLTRLYQLISKWNENTPLQIREKITEKDINYM